MITEIRKIAKGRVVKIFLLIMLAALGGVFSLPTLFQQIATGPWVAKVNGIPISYNLFSVNEAIHRNRINYFRQQYGKYADLLLQAQGKQLDSKELALQSLTSQELINQVASDLNIYLSDEFIASKLINPVFIHNELSDFIPQYIFDHKIGFKEKLLKRHLKQIGFSVREFEVYVEQLLKRKAVLQLAFGSVYVPDFIIKQFYNKKYLARKFSVALFNFDTYLQQVKLDPLSDKEIKSFYDQQNKNYKRYWVNEKRAGKIWEFDPFNYSINIDDDEIKAYYNANKYKKFVKTPAMVQIRKILFFVNSKNDSDKILKKAKDLHTYLLKNPKLFAEKAKKFSDDKDTAKNGGLAPEFPRGTHELSLDKAAFILKKDGDISNIIKVKEGFAIIQRVKKTKADIKSFSEVEQQIKTEIIKKNFSSLFIQDMQKSIVNNKLINESILKRAKKEITINLQIKGEDIVSKSLFKIKNKDFTFYIKDDKGYVITTTEIRKKHLPTIDTIKDQVAKNLYETKATQAMKNDMKKAKEMLLTGKPFSELKNNFKVSLSDTGFIKKNDATNIDIYRKKGYPVDNMTSLEKIGSVGIFSKEFDGYVVQVNEVEEFNQNEYYEKYKEMKMSLYKEQSQQLIESLIASLSGNATIKINSSIFLR